MTLREIMAVKGMRPALLAFAVGLAVTGWAYKRASEPVVVPPLDVGRSFLPDALNGQGKVEDVNVMAAVAVDVFAPERKAPAKRYRVPGEALPPPEPPRPVVLGTYVSPDLTFATCQLESSRLVQVRVGDAIGIYQVKSIERGRVVFTTPTGKQLDILALKPGS